MGNELPQLVPSLAGGGGGGGGRGGRSGGGGGGSSTERDVASVVQVFEGADTCRSADMVMPRRSYVFHVCPGHTPASLRAAREAVRRAAAPPAAGGGGGASAARVVVPGWAGEPVSAGRWPPLADDWNGGGGGGGGSGGGGGGASAAAAEAQAGDAASGSSSGAQLAAAVLRAATGAAAAAPSALGGLVDVQEDGMCTYLLTLATPLACSKARARDVRGALEAVLGSGAGARARGAAAGAGAAEREL